MSLGCLPPKARFIILWEGSDIAIAPRLTYTTREFFARFNLEAFLSDLFPPSTGVQVSRIRQRTRQARGELMDAANFSSINRYIF
jgi:hypothetical protein